MVSSRKRIGNEKDKKVDFQISTLSEENLLSPSLI